MTEAVLVSERSRGHVTQVFGVERTPRVQLWGVVLLTKPLNAVYYTPMTPLIIYSAKSYSALYVY